MAKKKTEEKKEDTKKTTKETTPKKDNIKEVLQKGDKDQIYTTITKQGTNTTPNNTETTTEEQLTKLIKGEPLTPEEYTSIATHYLTSHYKLRKTTGIITHKDGTATSHTWLQIMNDEEEWTNYDLTAATNGQKQGEVLGDSYLITEIKPIN